MKLFNIFKKETKKSTKSNVQKLEKNQLNKVIGGGGPDIPEETENVGWKSKSNIRTN